MARTTIDLDRHAFDSAKAALHTDGLSETVNAALREVARREALKGFDVRNIDVPTIAEIEEGRNRDIGPGDVWAADA